MILITYQSKSVLEILKSKKIYRAKQSIGYRREYGALIHMLDLKCLCPIFAVVKGRKQNTSGRVSGAVKFILDVPDDQIKFTEFSEWADFLYASKHTKPYDYTKLVPGCEEMTHRRYSEIIENLSNPLPQEQYRFPQAILEKIDPKWIVRYEILPNNKSAINFMENLFNKFRK